MEYLSLFSYFPKLAYESLLTSSESTFTESDYPDLRGQKWLVTGSTGGIGKEISRLLLKQHAELWVVGRSQQKLNDLVASLSSEYPGSLIHTVLVDFKDLASFKPAVEKIYNETSFLNGIIHNAGIMSAVYGKTVQGFEETIGVNNLAPQLLQDLLDPLVVNVKGARIVWLSSLAHITAPFNGFNQDLVNSRFYILRYSMSKALDYIMAIQWTKRHPESEVKSLAVHPGIIRSDLLRQLPLYQRKLFDYLMQDTKQGAMPVLYAALCPNVVNNDYIVPLGRSGSVRPDVYNAARGSVGTAALAWIESQISQYK